MPENEWDTWVSFGTQQSCTSTPMRKDSLFPSSSYIKLLPFKNDALIQGARFKEL